MANEFFTDQYTSMIQRVIQEIVSDPATYLGIRYIPTIALPVSTIQADVWEATGGLANEHAMGADPLYIQRTGARQQEFAPPAYREAIQYTEQDIVKLRALGSNDRSQRGIRAYINKDVDRLNRRLEARMEKLRWDAIFTGGFTYFSKAFSYGIPSSNNATPLNGNWSLDGINPNPAAKPLEDLRYWLNSLVDFRKYTVTRIVMNPTTARWFMDSPNVRSYIQNAMANPGITGYDINKVFGFFLPGSPPVEVYKGWWQDETVVAGKITVGAAQFFIPDGKIFFETALPDSNTIGELVLGLHLGQGTIDSPGYGKFIVPDENIAPGTKGGPKNPYVDLVSGFNGGVNLYRYMDVLTATVS